MVDLDEVAVNICIEHLPEWNAGYANDPRLEIIYGDAKAFLETYESTFDVIILDVCDPIEAGPAYVIYTQEFYTFAASKLNPNGVLVTQSGACSLYNFKECFTAIHKTLAKSFDKVYGYNVNIPSFVGIWGFNIAFKNAESDNCKRFDKLDEETIDQFIETRLGKDTMKFYDGVTHRRLFALSKPIRKGLEQENRIITVDNPVFMY
mmetsp:Transcript_9840/g.12279  ORF Transcript_9840/g.12279 Transcript_9840/m.12279 type:complete len:206 (+) Transcript_9840:1-618(+)